MIIPDEKLINVPVMSLQTSGQIAVTKRPIIDPADLAIIAFEVAGQQVTPPHTTLRLADVREISDIGLIVDSADEFIASDDVVQLQSIIELRFNLLGMPVLDEKRRKIGKIIGFTIDTNDFTIQQLRVKRPFLKSFNDTELLVHRSQITEINDDAVIVHSRAEIPEPTLDSIRQSYVNPFRSAGPAPEPIDQK